MVREIKFRAWDEKQKKMLYGVSIGTIKVWDENAPILSHEFSYSEDCIFEQYTGLKDENGKEIYEGDVMAQTLIDDPFTKKYPIYVVCWDGEFLSWALKDVSGDDGNDTDLHFFIEEWKKCEVIGNIHENPELLK